jgi:hypothetical protein
MMGSDYYEDLVDMEDAKRKNIPVVVLENAVILRMLFWIKIVVSVTMSGSMADLFAECQSSVPIPFVTALLLSKKCGYSKRNNNRIDKPIKFIEQGR